MLIPTRATWHARHASFPDGASPLCSKPEADRDYCSPGTFLSRGDQQPRSHDSFGGSREGRETVQSVL